MAVSLRISSVINMFPYPAFPGDQALGISPVGLSPPLVNYSRDAIVVRPTRSSRFLTGQKSRNRRGTVRTLKLVARSNDSVYGRVDGTIDGRGQLHQARALGLCRQILEGLRRFFAICRNRPNTSHQATLLAGTGPSTIRRTGPSIPLLSRTAARMSELTQHLAAATTSPSISVSGPKSSIEQPAPP